MESIDQTLILTTSLLQARSNPRSDELPYCISGSCVSEPATESKELLGFVSENGLCPPAQINVQWRRHIFALPLSLQALQLVHGAIKLSVKVSFVAE
jgi:hypothetical protein